jgi:maltooligosyltrehalose trehalohydrolase
LAEPVGAFVRDGRTNFSVWAPARERVHLVLESGERVEMAPRDGGRHEVSLEGAQPGVRYRFAFDGDDDALPDPASRSQPDGVHGASAVDDGSTFAWTDGSWRGRPLSEYVVYEVHVGTFTDDGTFDAAIEHLDELAALGITAIEVMPIAQFPGARNWGYDGVFPYAAQHSYGGPGGFRRFVDAAHGAGLAVVLDVVYNHLGPEGNVLGEYGPYFTARYRTPWGDAFNFDGPESDAVRQFFVDSALQWVDDFHVDALRVDAVHAIVDASAYPFVEQLTDAVHEVGERTGRHVHAIAESAANDTRVVTPSSQLGLGCDAQWSDDFHHALHALLTGETFEYYADFGRVEDLASAFRNGWAYAGRYSRFRRRAHGRSAQGLPGQRFVVFAQNHDHIGNRAGGDRLSELVDTDGLKVAAAAVLLAPYVPLLFMGEEYGETAPFPYFTSHRDRALADAVREGRAEEFAEAVGTGDVPDPQDPATCRSAVLDRRRREKEPHATVLDWHRALLDLRRRVPALARLDPSSTTTLADEDARTLVVRRPGEHDDDVIVVLCFAPVSRAGDVPVLVDLRGGRWHTLLDSHRDDARSDLALDGDDAVELHRPPRSVLVLQREP